MGNMIRAHAAAYRAIHELQPEARVGYALHYRPMVPRIELVAAGQTHAQHPLQRTQHGLSLCHLNGVMKSPIGNQNIPEAKGTQDYFGLNYYSVDTVWFDLFKPRELFSNSGYPKGRGHERHTTSSPISPKAFSTRSNGSNAHIPNLPIIITENGVEDSADQHASALSGAAYPSDVARGQLQLAREGLLPLVTGG